MKIRRKRKVNFIPVKLLLLSFVFIYFCVTFVNQHVAIAQLENKSEALQKQIEEQKTVNLRIEEDMQQQSELERIEDVARSKLGFLKDNEILFVDSSTR